MSGDADTYLANADVLALDLVSKAVAYIDKLSQLAVTTLDVSLPDTSNPSSVSSRQDEALGALVAAEPDGTTVSAFSGTVDVVPAVTTQTYTAPTVPTADYQRPSISIPDVPSITFPDAPSSPTITDTAFPDAPSITFPDVPSLSDIAIPSPPVLQTPQTTFATPDVIALIVPTNNFIFNEVEYQSTLLDDTRSAILDIILNGGSGIPTDIQTAMFQRAVDNEQNTASQNALKVRRQYAASGFPVPTGAMFEALRSNSEQSMGNIGAINRDILIKAADMEISTRQFYIQQAIAVESMLINYANSRMERALNYTKLTADVALMFYNAAVQKYQLEFQLVDAQIKTVDLQLREDLNSIEIYKAEMEAAKVHAQIEELQMESYKTQIQAIEVRVQVYKSQLEAVKTYYETQSLKLQRFESEVKAYVAQIQANSVKVEVYRTQVEAEKVKEDIYKTDVEAYHLQIEAARTTSQIELAKVQANTENMSLLLKQYDGKMAKYNIDVTAWKGKTDADVRKYGEDVALFGHKAPAIIKAYEFFVESFRLYLDWLKMETDKTLAKAKIQLDELVAGYNFKLRATESVAGISKDIAAAAMAGINGLGAVIKTTSS
jgi:hypothetical protein